MDWNSVESDFKSVQSGLVDRLFLMNFGVFEMPPRL